MKARGVSRSPATQPPRVQHGAEINGQEATDGRQAQQNASPVDGHTSANRAGQSGSHDGNPSTAGPVRGLQNYLLSRPKSLPLTSIRSSCQLEYGAVEEFTRPDG